MPRAQKPPTPEILLAVMKPGVVYSPHVIAAKIRAPSFEVKRTLLVMVDEGKVTILKPRKGICFILAGTEHLRRQPEPKPKVDPATVAQPRTYAVLTGEIFGYDAETARRQELCMSIRRVA